VRRARRAYALCAQVVSEFSLAKLRHSRDLVFREVRPVGNERHVNRLTPESFDEREIARQFQALAIEKSLQDPVVRGHHLKVSFDDLLERGDHRDALVREVPVRPLEEIEQLPFLLPYGNEVVGGEAGESFVCVLRICRVECIPWNRVQEVAEGLASGCESVLQIAETRYLRWRRRASTFRRVIGTSLVDVSQLHELVCARGSVLKRELFIELALEGGERILVKLRVLADPVAAGEAELTTEELDGMRVVLCLDENLSRVCGPIDNPHGRYATDRCLQDIPPSFGNISETSH